MRSIWEVQGASHDPGGGVDTTAVLAGNSNLYLSEIFSPVRKVPKILTFLLFCIQFVIREALKIQIAKGLSGKIKGDPFRCILTHMEVYADSL